MGDSVALFSYGDRGLQYESDDGNNLLWFGVRLQSRYSYEEFDEELGSGTLASGTTTRTDENSELKRGRFKLGGHLFSPKFQVYTELDYPSDRLIDMRATYEFADWLNIRIGQWKAEFNRERVDSSGAQQFVERSIATSWFTIDRQQSIVASGRIAQGSATDSSYWFGWLSGAGRGGSLSDADGLWMGRYQWNISGELLAFSQSDIGRRGQAASSVAVALIEGNTQYTSFSSAGGGQLEGFSGGAADRYRLRQAVLETAYQHRGFSWQQEFHWKNIRDKTNGTTSTITGGYAQAGVFLSRLWPAAPTPLELALRYAWVDASDYLEQDTERETSLVANWFFTGHRNKLTADISYLDQQPTTAANDSIRLRLQWDWSF